MDLDGVGGEPGVDEEVDPCWVVTGVAVGPAEQRLCRGERTAGGSWLVSTRVYAGNDG